MKKLYFVLFVFILAACQENNESGIFTDGQLIGIWGNSTYTGDQIAFKRIASLPDKDYAIQFLANNVFIERSSGFCGTPPLTFYSQEGNWKREQNIISVTGPNSYPNYSWEIISLNENELTVQRVLTEQEKDHRALMNLYQEIYNLSKSVACKDANDWSFTAYGSKACGGPQGYIPFSKQIDTIGFKQKVKHYSNEEHKFNIKWNIVSTCDIAPRPKGISCIDSIPNLNY